MPLKILVVDDEPDLEVLVRQRFRRKIRDGEFDFSFAQNGREALEKLRAGESIDVVMSDINMPEMDGLTLLGHLHDSSPDLKTVIVSAYGDMENIRTAMNRGAYDFLTKPIDFQDFEVTVQKTFQEVERIRQGARATKQLTAIQNELSVASRIQQSILPREFLSGRDDFELYAQMIPAQEVGGDFYDFFLIGKDRLGFVIGDVSGKGVPAAIFMAVSRTLLRATAVQGLSASECVHYANNVLARQSEASMFVTTFYGILNTSTGEVEYCSGGHNPPYLFSPSAPPVPLEEPRGLMVGMFEDAQYEAGRITLAPGEGILLYTDGVTEAQNAALDQFGDRRLKDALERSKSNSAQDIIQTLFSEVRGFAGGAPQADDITVLALRYLG